MKYLDDNKKDLLIIILIFAIISLVKIILSLPFTSPYIMMDEVYYDSIAQNVLNGKLYATIMPLFGTIPPGYSIFLSVAYLFSQDKSTVYHIMLAINSLIITSIIFPSFFILKKYCSRSISILGAIIIATLPIVNLFTFVLMSENLFIPLFVFSVWFLIESYETNKKIWQFLASLSIVFIYMTRSTGIAMLIGFIAAFIYYAFVNRKEKTIVSIIKEKWVLLLSFIVLLSLWMAYTTFCIPGSSYSFGSPYSVQTTYTERITSIASNIDVLKAYLIPFVREMDYLSLSTYFILLFMIIYYVRAFIRKDDIKNSIMIAFFYFIVSSLGLLAISTTFLSYNYEQLLYGVYGRYIEPIVPLVFVFGILGLSKFCTEGHNNYKKWILPFFFYITIICFIVSTFPLKNYDIAHTLSVYYLYIIYNAPLEFGLLVTFAIAIFLLIYLEFIDLQYLSILIAVLICFSLIFSAATYYVLLKNSNMASDDITQYLQKNSNKNTIVFISKDDSTGLGHYLQSEAIFWCKGTIVPISNISNISSIDYSNNTVYAITQQQMQYKELAKGYFDFKLYQL